MCILSLREITDKCLPLCRRARINLITRIEIYAGSPPPLPLPPPPSDSIDTLIFMA
ncbi:hypothetical protein ACFW04_006349 [Cataglyphis niger]